MSNTNQESTKDTNEETETKRGRGRPKGLVPGSLNEDKERNRKYRRDYYHNKLKTEIHCEICNKMFVCKSSLTRHHLENKKCEIIQINRDIKELLGSDASEDIDS